MYGKCHCGTTNDRGSRLQMLFNKRIQHRCFPVKSAKFLRTSFLQNSSGGCFWNEQDQGMHKRRTKRNNFELNNIFS